MLRVLVTVVLLSHGSWGLGQGVLGPPAHGERGPVDLPWHDELCCSPQPSALRTLAAGGSTTAGVAPVDPAPRASQQHPARCRYRSLKSSSQPGGNNQRSGGICWRVRCALDDDWENVVCNLKSGGPPPQPSAGVSAVISLQRLALQTQASAAEVAEVAEPLVATGDPLVCSIALDDNTNGSIAMVTIAVLNTSAPPVLLQVPLRPVWPSPPVNVSHTQMTDGQLIVSWSDPAPPIAAAAPPPRRYEVRYAVNSTRPVWQALSLNNQALSLNNQALSVNNQALSLNNQALSLNNQALSLNNQALSLNNQALSLNNQALSLNNQACLSLNNQALSLNNQALSVNNQALSLNNQALSLNNQALSVNNQALSLNNQALSLNNQAHASAWLLLLHTVLHVSGEPRVVLDLTPTMVYILQVRSSLPGQPRPLWSAWSPAHRIELDKVSYIPEKVLVSPGQNVTVYCVFNDRSANASSATWLLNLNLTHPIPRHQYTPINQWVGASIDISCETNGDVDTMTCSWENHHLTKLSFLS
ncbi:hypothetical protein CRUP_014246, partial [Coryphaenoides rupestris]